MGNVQAAAAIDQQSVHRCAWQMLRAHSDEALPIARETADRLEAEGDAYGHELWVAVVAAIENMATPIS